MIQVSAGDFFGWLGYCRAIWILEWQEVLVLLLSHCIRIFVPTVVDHGG